MMERSPTSTQALFNLRDTAEALQLDQTRLYRLGRQLRLAPGDPCIPLPVIVQARAELDDELRYRSILQWLLAHWRDVPIAATES